MFEAFLKALTPGAVGVWTLVGVVVTAIIKSKPTLNKIANDREANLLAERAKEMEGMRRAIAKLEAERATDRHRINNLSQCLDALLMMIEMDPAKAAEAAAKIKAMRASQMEAEATEKAAIHAAEIATAAKADAK